MSESFHYLLQMKKKTVLIALLICIANAAYCQKLFLLERPGTTKHYIFKTGNRIRLYDGKSMRMIQGDISRISDTMIVINSIEPVSLGSIRAVYRPLTMLHLFSRASTTAGAGYFLLAAINNSVNNDSPVIDRGTLIFSSVTAGLGIATSFIRYRKFAIGTKWRIKVIDLNNPGK